jgi:transposase
MARAGGLTAKLHAVTDGGGRPLRFLPSAGQVGDHAGALALPDTLPRADRLVADQGHDADWFREALADKAISPASPADALATGPSSTTSAAVGAATASGTMFGRLKDRRRVAARCDRPGPPRGHRPRRHGCVPATKPEPSLCE